MALLLALFTIAVFWQATFNGFVNYDDPEYVLGNPVVLDGLSRPGLSWAFTTDHACNWHPVTWLSHMLDCQLFGLQAWGHHLTAIVIHGLSTGLLFLVLRRLTGNFWPALAVAAIFGVHPTRVESVAWVSERKDVLSTFFWMATLGAYSRWIAPGTGGRERKRWYAIALGTFALGLLSKPMMVTLPCVLLLLDYWPAKRFREMSHSKLLIEKLPFVLMVIVSIVVTLIVQQGAMSSLEKIPPASRVTNALVSYVRYLWQLLWPTGLAVYYPRPDHWPWTQWLPALLLLFSISAAAWWHRTKRPYLLVGWLWYLGTAVPVIGLVQVGTQAMADRYTYIPGIGLLIMLAWGGTELAVHFRLPAKALRVAVAAVVVTCVLLTSMQIGYWRDGETLFRHTLSVTPPSALAYSNLGSALLEKGQHEASMPYFLDSLRLSPDDAKARYNYGLALSLMGRTPEAIAELERSLTLAPTWPMPHVKLGLALLASDRVGESVQRFAEAVRLDPQDVQSRYYFAESLRKTARFEDAILHYREAIQMRPDVPESYLGLAGTLGLMNRKPEAIAIWQRALQLKPDHVKAHINLGVLLGEAGRIEEAARHFRTAVQLDPKDGDAAFNLQIANAELAKQRTKPAGN